MSVTKINGNLQILAGSIPWAQMATGAIVPTTSLVDGANFSKKDGSVTWTADWNAGGFKLTGLGNGVSAQDAATVSQLNSLKAGFQLHFVRIMSVANVGSLSGLPTIDGLTMSSGDRLCLTAQTTGSQNGIWVVASGAWTRPTDWAAAAVLPEGQYVIAEADGTTYKNTKWFCTNTGSFTVDTTSTTFVQDAGGTSYTNGNGLSLTGTTFAVKTGNGTGFDGSNNVVAVGDAAGLISVGSSGIAITSPTAAQIMIGSATPKPSWATVSGDVTIGSTGVTTVNHTSGSGFLKYTDFIYNETPSGTVNGSNTSFTLANTPANSSLELCYNGVVLEPGSGNDYTISAATITMLFAPATGDKLRAYYTK